MLFFIRCMPSKLTLIQESHSVIFSDQAVFGGFLNFDGDRMQ